MSGYPYCDTEFQEVLIEGVDDYMDTHDPHFTLKTDAGMLDVPNLDRLPLPAAGTTARFYGRGFGYTVRGVIAGDVVYYYRTAEQQRQKDAQERAEREAQQEREWTEKTQETAARIAALPELFRRRIEFFLRRPAWGPTFGFYELFVCEEAVKIATACRGVEDIRAFRDDTARQKGVISDEHSGNTFSAACHLAQLYAAHPESVPRTHGALCPLVGCSAYGCWSTTQEAE